MTAADTLDPGIPGLAADWLDSHEWVQRSMGDGITTGCLHRAVLTVCGDHPGDQHMWRPVLRWRGFSERWQDDPYRTKSEVVAAMRATPDEPTVAEMVTVFGPQWEQVRDLVRRAVLLTDDEAVATDARLYAASYTAWAAARARATDKAWEAAVSAAWAAARARAAAWDAIRGAPAPAADAAADAAAGAARAAAMALAVRHLIGHRFTQAHYDLLTHAWRTVVGPVHPDDQDPTTTKEHTS